MVVSSHTGHVRRLRHLGWRRRRRHACTPPLATAFCRWLEGCNSWRSADESSSSSSSSAAEPSWTTTRAYGALWCTDASDAAMLESSSRRPSPPLSLVSPLLPTRRVAGPAAFFVVCRMSAAAGSSSNAAAAAAALLGGALVALLAPLLLPAHLLTWLRFLLVLTSSTRAPSALRPSRIDDVCANRPP